MLQERHMPLFGWYEHSWYMSIAGIAICNPSELAMLW